MESVKEAIKLIEKIPIQTHILYTEYTIYRGEIEEKIFKSGIITSKSNDNKSFMVDVKMMASPDSLSPGWSKVDFKETQIITAEDLVQKNEFFPPKIKIFNLTVPKNKKSNNGKSEGGRRKTRKHKKSKKQSKKQTRRHK
jgi:hypothetical protein